MEITFMEKEPYPSYDRFECRNCLMYPTFMIKDGEEFFVFNRREPDKVYLIREGENQKRHLIMTGGRYFKFHGEYDDPLVMLEDVIRSRHRFTDFNEMFWCSIEKNRYEDFHGNRIEVSAAFHYRIYDTDLLAKIKHIVDLIKKEKYEEAEATLNASQAK